MDDEWHKMVKKEDGFFEIEVIIKTKKGSEVSIVRMTGPSSYSFLVSYKVI